MKQLLHTATATIGDGGSGGGGGGDLLAFALGHRAFIYSTPSTNHTRFGVASSAGYSCSLIELEIPIQTNTSTTTRVATTTTTTTVTPSSVAPETAAAAKKEEAQGVDRSASTSVPTNSTSSSKKKPKNVQPEDLHPSSNEGMIQAIAVHADVICVALQNKQLLMYRRREGQQQDKPCCSYPIVAHYVTEKRVTKLLFAPLPTADQGNDQKTDTSSTTATASGSHCGDVRPAVTTTTDNLILLAADVVGDATAYEIPSLSSMSQSARTGIADKPKRKFLLGHTASVLTDLCLLVSSSSLSSSNRYKNYLLTADRDEKIRVSHFPRCYDIYGYLLAHTAFVTSVTALMTSNSKSTSATIPALATTTTTTTTLVASTAGDGQLMIWNVETCEKIASCEIVGGGTAEDAIITATNNNTNNTIATKNNAIPTKLLALADAALLVICDQDPRLYGFTYCEQEQTLYPMQLPFLLPAVPIDIVCWYRSDDDGDGTASLAVLFQNAPYVRLYDCVIMTIDNGTTTTATTTTTALQLTETTPEDLTKALLLAIPFSSISEVQVPGSLLERGKDGIVLAKHAREYTESLLSPNDPDRMPGKKDKIIRRHEKRQNKKKKNTTLT